MKLFKSITNRSYSFKAVKRTIAASFVFGFGLAVYTVVAIYPVAADMYANLANYMNPPVVVQNNQEPVPAVSSIDKIEEYTDQEITRLTDKYQRLLREEARMNAITRIEAELEVEKEKLREEALFQ